jgi:hypothetical protein
MNYFRIPTVELYKININWFQPNDFVFNEKGIYSINSSKFNSSKRFNDGKNKAQSNNKKTQMDRGGIIIVSPEMDMTSSIRLEDGLGKKGFSNLTIWSINTYNEKAFALRADTPLIYLGGPNGNPISKQYIDSGVVVNITDGNSFFIGQTSKKIFLCGKGDAFSTQLAVDHFLEYFANQYLISIK